DRRTGGRAKARRATGRSQRGRCDRHPDRHCPQTRRWSASGMKTDANARAASDEAPWLTRLVHRLARIDDGAILRVAFYALLAGTAGVVYIDYREREAALPPEISA